jgi:uncharacterized membrane protein
MSVESFAAALQSTAFSDALKSAGWIVPALQTVHILMIGLVFVSILMIALKVLGRLRADEPLSHVWKRFAPFLWAGLVVMAVSGILLVIAEPVREFMTLSFRLKMVLLAFGVVSAAMFGRKMRAAANSAADTVQQQSAPAGLRVAAMATVALWIAIIFLGRAIAYDDSVWGDWSPVESLGGAAT